MLSSLQTVFSDLTARGVRYAAWKSLENLEDSLRGGNDVDVLFLDKDREKVFDSLSASGFVVDDESPATLDDQLIEFRGFDPESGRFAAFHVHFACRFGSKRFKEYRFPYEEEMITDAIESLGIKTINQAHFFVTRLLHVVAKENWDDSYLTKLASEFSSSPEIRRERGARHLERYLGSGWEDMISRLAQSGPTALKPVADQIRRQLEQEAPTHPVIERIKAHSRPKHRLNGWARKILPIARTKIGTGAEVLVAGHDGAGKTTTTDALERMLSPVAPTRRIYLGRNTWSRLNAWINKRREGRFPFLNHVWPYTSTIELVLRLLGGKLRKALGFIVLYDRSLSDLELKYRKESRLKKWFPVLASKLFSRLQGAEFLLVAEPEEVIRRKGKHSREEIANLRDWYQQKMPRARIIDTTSTPPELVAGMIAENVMKGIASRMRRPSRIAFVGTDGVGKTTIANALRQGPLGDAVYVYFGMKHHHFKALDGYRQAGTLRWPLYKWLLLPVDLFLRARSLDPTRPHIIDRIPIYPFVKEGAASRIYGAALPRIDNLIWLRAAPEEIHARKPDNSLERIEYDHEKIRLAFDLIPAKRRTLVDVTGLNKHEALEAVKAAL